MHSQKQYLEIDVFNHNISLQRNNKIVRYLHYLPIIVLALNSQP